MDPGLSLKNNSCTFIGQGSEHWVCRHVRYPESVLKISILKCRAILSHFPGLDRPQRHLLEEYALTKFEPDIREKNEQILELQKFFGAMHVPPERRHLAQPRLSREFVQSLFVNEYWNRGPPQWLGEREPIWTHVAVQAFCSAAQDPDRLSLSFGRFTEDGPHDRAEYREVHSVLRTPDARFRDRKQFLSLQDHSAGRCVTQILERADSDSVLKATLVEFVTKAIRYARQTRNILALAGKDNAIFARVGEGWTYYLIDVLPIQAGRLLEQAEAIARRAQAGEPLRGPDRETVNRSLNFIRLIDGLAICLGVNERVGLSAGMAAAADLNLAPPLAALRKHVCSGDSPTSQPMTRISKMSSIRDMTGQAE